MACKSYRLLPCLLRGIRCTQSVTYKGSTTRLFALRTSQGVITLILLYTQKAIWSLNTLRAGVRYLQGIMAILGYIETP